MIRYLKMTPRSLIVTLIVLVVFDIFIRLYWANLYIDSGARRLVNQEVETLINLRDRIKKAEGYTIVFIGDSQTYGSAIKNVNYTIPAFFAKEIQKTNPNVKIKVFNFAYKGYGISENYFILQSLLDSGVDLIVFNVSTSWFNRQEIMEHSNVLNLSTVYPEAQKLISLGINARKGSKEIMKGQAQYLIGKVWNLYQHKSAIMTMLLGKPLRERLSEYQLRLYNPKEYNKQRDEENRLFQPWYEKDWKSILGKVNYNFGTVNLNSTNPQVIIYKMMLESINKSQTSALFYLSPQNIKMLDKYYGMDYTAWDNSLINLQQMTDGPNVKFLDYTSIIPDYHFSDTIHLTDQGNQIAAQQLAKDLGKIIGSD